MGLTSEQQAGWERDGFFFLRGFATADQLGAMTERIFELVRAHADGEPIAPAYVQQEKRLVGQVDRPEDHLSKLFRVHREEPVFREFLTDPRLLAIAGELLGTNIDCFLSQFIAKHPGALGQPWHQDAFYFPFDRGPQVGLWLAITEARLDNGPLWVVPGSHRDEVHKVVADSRPDANLGYVEIVDRDTSDEQAVLMAPGDLLLFHSHLMHRSTDNGSDISRMAMVYHLADGDTIDQTQEKWGFTPPNIDWVPLVRDGMLVAA
jgi:phytanoyl-CoA hydroxylase